MSTDQLYIYRARIVRIIDGDSVVIMLDHGRRLWQEVYARLYGINAPEVRGEEREQGIKATGHLISLLAMAGIYTGQGKPSSDCYIKTHRDRTGKYGRDLVTIYLDDLGDWPPTHSANQQMIDDGFAVKY